jgi:hypothetical protein
MRTHERSQRHSEGQRASAYPPLPQAPRLCHSRSTPHPQRRMTECRDSSL